MRIISYTKFYVKEYFAAEKDCEWRDWEAWSTCKSVCQKNQSEGDCSICEKNRIRVLNSSDSNNNKDCGPDNEKATCVDDELKKCTGWNKNF